MEEGGRERERRNREMGGTVDTTARRVERLLLLIENLGEGGGIGKSSGSEDGARVRTAVARQLASLCATSSAHRADVLLRLYAQLRSKDFEVRLTAAAATAAVAQEVGRDGVHELRTEALLTLESFEIGVVLRRGSRLMATAGKEYARWEEEQQRLAPEERLRRARKHLKKRLGIDDYGGAGPAGDNERDAGDGMGELVVDDDLISNGNTTAGVSKVHAPMEDSRGLLQSVRERKAHSLPAAITSTTAAHTAAAGASSANWNTTRKRQENSEQQQQGGKELEEEHSEPNKKKMRVHDKNGAENRDEANASARCDGAGETHDDTHNNDHDDPDGGKSLCKMCQQLLDDTLSPRWEVRHGALTCLRDVLSASRRMGSRWIWMTNTWLEDCASRVICVLALDRFGDYEDDSVIAPVREIAGQVIGVALHLIPEKSTLSRAAAMVSQLVKSSDADVRLGGMLGLKYLLAVAKVADCTGAVTLDVLAATLPTLVTILEEEDESGLGAGDEVRAAAMDALANVAHALGKTADAKRIFTILWKLLAEYDDLSAISTNAMRLLVAMYRLTAAEMGFDTRREMDGVPESITTLMERVSPYLQNSVRNTRSAAASLLSCLASASPVNALKDAQDTGSDTNAQNTIYTVLSSLFRAILVEVHDNVLAAMEEAWNGIVTTQNTFSLCTKSDFLDVRRWPDNTSAHETETARLRIRTVVARCLSVAVRETERRGDEADIANVTRSLSSACSSTSSANRQFVAEILYFLGLDSSIANAVVEPATTNFKVFESSGAVYDESGGALRRMRASVVALCKAEHRPQADETEVHTPESASGLLASVSSSAPADATSSAARQRLANDIEALRSLDFGQQVTVDTSLSRAILRAARSLPSKVTPFISPVVRSIEYETQPFRVWIAASAAGRLIHRLVSEQRGAGGKVLMKLQKIMSCNSLPASAIHIQIDREADFDELRAQSERFNYASGKALLTKAPDCDDCAHLLIDERRRASLQAIADFNCVAQFTTKQTIADEEGMTQQMIARVNAEMAVRIALASFQSMDGNDGVTEFWENISASLRADDTSDVTRVAALHMLRVVADVIRDRDMALLAVRMLPLVLKQSKCVDPVVRMTAARTCGAFACAASEIALPMLLSAVSQSLAMEKENLIVRRGMSAALCEIAANFRNYSYSYLIMLLVPLLKRMADPDDAIRGAATRAFSELVPFFPLARDAPLPSGLPELQMKSLQSDKKLLMQLLDNSSVDDVDLPFSPNTPLRRYQQEGVNWLEFLRRFGMHGVLADDMGLGKTLQTLCILALALYRENGGRVLIVCPTTLVRHWAAEASKHIPDGLLKPVVIQGNAAEKVRQKKLGGNMVICSYETLRSEVKWFSARNWLYCVLDEGHVVKNPKTKVAAAVRAVGAKSSHRLVLSGTPIQNSPTELWGLFQFLMPGFLGSHADFSRAYAGDIKRARSKKADADAVIACEDAAERLHKTIMPFVLRRTKEKVLKDLPPKIIQDMIVDQSPLQELLLGLSEAGHADSADGGWSESSSSSFSRFMHLRKLATHPALVFNASDEGHIRAAQSALGVKTAVQIEGALQHVEQSPKLVGLRQLLLDCGIGETDDADADVQDTNREESKLASASGGHRVLVFAQMARVLDLIEKDLFGDGATLRGGLRGVSWLRLDGRVPASDRVAIAEKFNSDPSIRVLLLTTQVGSLGLNLASADTCIFMEHDWNPQRDLQAMDRAHRLGQKRTVFVYRLIARGTIEEEIMSLQRFKVGIAEAVVNQENVSMEKMDTGALLDVFASKPGQKAKSGVATTTTEIASGAGVSQPLATAIRGFDSQWDASEYGEEFSVAEFEKNLATASPGKATTAAAAAAAAETTTTLTMTAAQEEAQKT